MTSEPIDGSADAQVVPLRAKDAGTEVRTTEAPGAGVHRPVGRTGAAQGHHPRPLADLGGGPRACEARRRTARSRRRLPQCPGTRLRGADRLVGAGGHGRTVSLLLAWWHVPDLHRLERQAAADGLLSDHLRIHKAGREVRTARGLILAACAVMVVAALVVLSRAPARAWILLGAVALPLLARAGRPAGKPTVTGADPFRRSAGRHKLQS
jgi:hypothetical protein